MDVYWPHEAVSQGHLSKYSLKSHERDIAKRNILEQWLRIKVRSSREPRKSHLKREYARHTFALYNGNCPFIEGKKEFTNLVRSKLGYGAPTSVALLSGQTHKKLLAEVELLDLESPVRLCKPWFGSKGHGLYVAPTPEEAVKFAHAQKRPYLIQNLLPSAIELRYICHRTASDISQEGRPSIRMATLKWGPSVIGDGKSTVKQLIDAQTSWPSTDRMKLAIAAPIRIPAPGEVVQLVDSGNISQGRYHELPSPDALKQLDTLLLDQFLPDLEASMGGVLGTACWDIGISRPNALANGTLSKADLIFYEAQWSFNNPYGKSDPVFRKEAKLTNASLLLAHSMLYTGCVLRSPR